jgi:hypothetical protein
MAMGPGYHHSGWACPEAAGFPGVVAYGMFRWPPTWDMAHLAFFGATCAVLAGVGASLVLALWRVLRSRRTRREGAASGAWQVRFASLPASVRACRHQLTGEAPDRECRRAFDCRSCAEHELLAARRPRPPARSPEASLRLGFDPARRFYSRSHLWVRLEKNGTATIGLDGIARRLLGSPESLRLPRPGTRLETHGTLGQVVTRGQRVRLLSPIDGTVIGVRGSGTGFKLRVRPDPTLDIRHLLEGPEAKTWSLRELERVLRAGDPKAGAPALTDGGELLLDLGAALPRERYRALLAETFLQA